MLLVLLLAAPLCGAPPVAERLTRDGWFKQRPAWSPDGKQLLYTQHRGARISLAIRAADGTTRRLVEKLDLPHYDGVWSPDGKRIALTHVRQSGTQGDLDVYLTAPDGTELAPFAANEGPLSHEESAAWSPDGRQIAFTSTAPGNQELFVAQVDRSGRVRLTNDPAIDAHPAWSPDGTRLVFATNRWGDMELATIDADGNNLTRVTDSRGLDDYPSWSPDGRLIAFSSLRDGNFEIYVCRADGSAVKNITEHSGHDNFPAWSPDGHLTFVSNREAGFDLYRIRKEALP